MTLLSSRRWPRPFFVVALVLIATVIYLSAISYVTSEFVIFIPRMVLAALGLALGSHLVIRDRVPSSMGRLIGDAFTGGLAGALLFLLGFETGVALANQLGLNLPEGAGWGLVFFPFWIYFSGGPAIHTRYLARTFLGNWIVGAIAGGTLGALVGDDVMTLAIFRPAGPDYLHTPLAMTATFGALFAAGLAWAERKVPLGSPEATDTSSANDITGQ